MYSDYQLDSPPPRSQFRRPWSPEPFDPTPRSDNSGSQRRLPGALEDDYDSQPLHLDHDYSRYPPAQPSHFIHTLRNKQTPHSTASRSGAARREASESSVEALDLADYARTLKQRQIDADASMDPYPAHYPPGSYRQPPPQFFAEQEAVANAIDLRAEIAAPPSAYRPPRSPLSSPVSTSTRPRSANSQHHDNHYRYTPPNSVDSHSTGPGRTTRRPFSLPPSSTSRPYYTPSNSRATNVSRPSQGNRRGPRSGALDDGIDLTTWNDGNRMRNGTRSPLSAYSHPSGSHTHDPQDRDTNLDPDVNSGQGTKKSIFDPGYIHNPYTNDFGSKNVNDTYRTPPPSFGHDSHFGTASREVLPWGQDPPEYKRQPLDPAVKEERMRMLEREFGTNHDPANGSKVKGKKKKDGEGEFLDENGQPLVGTVDDRGYLVTQGPKKRLLVRLMQLVLAAGVAIPAIYAAAVIKTEKPAPPAGKPATYVLYVVSVLTLLITLYLFVGRPCCCPPRRKSKKQGANPLAASGMMVLPVQGLPGGGGKKKDKNKPGGKKWKKGGMPPPGDVQVNLIMDPHVFGRQDESSSSDSSSDEELGSDWDWDSSMPGGVGDGSSSGGGIHGSQKKKEKKKGRRKPPKRRSIFAGLAMEEDWKKARGWTKKMTAVDVVMVVLWGGVFIFIMIGERCPSGMFDGWCDAYNVSTAAACLLAVAFGIHIFFDIKDLNSSKASPRTRV